MLNYQRWIHVKILKSNLELISKQDANSGLRREASVGRKKHQKHTHIWPSIIVQNFHCWYIIIYFCITIPTYAYHYFLLFYFSPAVPCLSLSLSLWKLSFVELGRLNQNINAFTVAVRLDSDLKVGLSLTTTWGYLSLTGIGMALSWILSIWDWVSMILGFACGGVGFLFVRLMVKLLNLPFSTSLSFWEN